MTPRLRLLAAGLAVTAALLLCPFHWNTNPIFWERLMDAAHLPFFAVFVLFLDTVNPFGLVMRGQRATAAVITALLTDAAIEVAQPHFGRESSMIDFSNGVLGIIIAALILRRRMKTDGIGFAPFALAFALMLIALRPAWHEARGIIWRVRNFPLLGDFESQDEFKIWLSTCQWDEDVFPIIATASAEHATHGDGSIMIKAHPTEHWGNVRFLAGDQDWRGYRALTFDIFNPGPPLELGVRIDDASSAHRDDDRFHTAVPLHEGLNHCSIALESVASCLTTRKFQLDTVRRIVIFFQVHPEPRTLYLDYVRLEK